MREQLDAIVSELRRLRREGVGRVAVSDASLKALRDLAASVKAEAGTASPAPVATSAAVRAGATPAAAPEPQAVRETPREETTIPVRETPVVKVSSPAAAVEKPLPAPPVVVLTADDASGRLAELGTRLLADPVSKARAATGSGTLAFDGAPDAPALFLIHMPGADDAIEGRLLSGAEGELYGKIVAAMGLPRTKIITTSLLPYRPMLEGGHDHREPSLEEIAYFMPYFRALVETVKPRVIIALGGGARDALLGRSGPISKTRGAWGEWEGIPVMPTYHISYLIRNNTNKSKRTVWEDMLEVMAKLRLPVSEKQLGYFKS